MIFQAGGNIDEDGNRLGTILVNTQDPKHWKTFGDPQTQKEHGTWFNNESERKAYAIEREAYNKVQTYDVNERYMKNAVFDPETGWSGGLGEQESQPVNPFMDPNQFPDFVPIDDSGGGGLPPLNVGNDPGGGEPPNWRSGDWPSDENVGNTGGRNMAVGTFTGEANPRQANKKQYGIGD